VPVGTDKNTQFLGHISLLTVVCNGGKRVRLDVMPHVVESISEEPYFTLI
jgi:hypothetical protein